MVSPFQLIWCCLIFFLVLLLLILLEMKRQYQRREKEVMFGSDIFDEKIKAFAFLPEEIDTLKKLASTSKFENKDAVLNSSLLFEMAVTEFYKYHNLHNVSDRTMAVVDRLRHKLDYTAQNPLSQVFSTRQFCKGDRIDLVLKNGTVFKHSKILEKNERDWSVLYDEGNGPGQSLVGEDVLVRWTRPDDAVYSVSLEVLAFREHAFLLPHSTELDKSQSRRWIRMTVNFPVKVVFDDGSTCGGMLYNMSAAGFLIGLPVLCVSGKEMNIEFELPSFGLQNVKIEILRNFGKKNENFPEYYSMAASFTGAFGWTQERILQYIFECNKREKEAEKGEKMI